MAHEKVYGICENKCQVRLPRIIKFAGHAYFSGFKLDARSYTEGIFYLSSYMSEDLCDKDWFVIPKLTSTSSLAGISVEPQIKNGALYYRIMNNTDAYFSIMSGVALDFLFIEQI